MALQVLPLDRGAVQKFAEIHPLTKAEIRNIVISIATSNGHCPNNISHEKDFIDKDLKKSIVMKFTPVKFDAKVKMHITPTKLC